MSDNSKIIYSVKELFTEFLNGRRFNIPDYQRGYKWTADNVTTLLNDLNKFNRNENEFYCLQNITVTDAAVDDKSDAVGDKLNVIDGQQRLTTIFLLLSYLDEVGKTLPYADCLLYSVRETTHKFLQEEVVTGKIWTSEIVPEDAKSKDQFYIAQACKAIHDWFKENEEQKDAMSVKILNNLKVIVNCVEPGEEELVFSNLNGGKVNLDGADLVRALLITRAARQKYGDMPDNLEKIGSFRAKLGLELDEAAQWWGQKDVKEYFTQLLPNGLARNNRFNKSDYPIDLLYYAFYEAYKNKFSEKVKCEDLDIRLFENGIDFNNKQGDDHLEFYEKISEFNLTMQDWFEDDEIFNLIGYLMYNFKATISFSKIWDIWSGESVQTKTDFVYVLKMLIRKSLALRFEPLDKSDEVSEDEISDRFGRLIDMIQKTDEDWYHKDDMIYPILAIADILPKEYIDKNSVRRTRLHRACITDFVRQSDEDKEHIRSQKRELYKIKEEDLTSEQKQALREENEKGLNSLGNLVLLHMKINRGYHNDTMDLKMDRIFGESALEDIHIRPYTQSVFRSKIRNLNNNGEFAQELFWSDDDVNQTCKSLAERIQNYLMP